MKNKRVKQMIVDVALQGRAAYWYQEETEIYAARSLEDIEYYFGEVEEFPDDWCNLVSADWRWWWGYQAGEVEGKIKGKKCKNRDGEIMKGWQVLPIICSVYGGPFDVAQVSTGCN